MMVMHEAPEWLAMQQHSLNVEARELYQQRNAAVIAGDLVDAADFMAQGDELLRWAIALTREWEA